MEFKLPGENLLLKLYESLADNGVPALLGPWQKRRMARADADAKVILALAEKEAEAIKAGTSPYKFKAGATLLEHADVEKGHPARKEPTLNLEEMTASVASADLAESIRRDVNTTKAIIVAENILSKDTQAPTNEEIDEDWLHSWREYAGKVSAEQLQELWGRVLAGEVKQPGSFSIRALEFLKGLSKKEADLIACASKFIISEIIHRDQTDLLNKAGLKFDQLLYLQEIGILAGVESRNLGTNYPSRLADSYESILLAKNKALRIEHSDSSKNLLVESYSITQLGIEILRLCEFDIDEEYFRAVALKVAKQGYKVTAADRDREDGGKFTNPQEIRVEDYAPV
ncbi:DUF2806 domain-containing protein [Microbulbifer sp. THAF38]|uniref:DUF2806 domain-containing protein n=1 Tax=Microbulbifer sp. THAF38 TaxID=2587856 RepID=UPI0012686CB4|nr:DUF2806 domain-containing protein [Microbulbifer sp. THAF38]QFT56482.1 hypothetical protein FIU95_18195 [Microbulbifer sp. THAF38]